MNDAMEEKMHLALELEEKEAEQKRLIDQTADLAVAEQHQQQRGTGKGGTGADRAVTLRAIDAAVEMVVQSTVREKRKAEDVAAAAKARRSELSPVAASEVFRPKIES